MNYNEFEMIMNKLNVSFLALDLYSDYFSQDFYEESGIYMILDNNVDLLTLFFRSNDCSIRDEIFDCLSIVGDEFKNKVANIYDKLQKSNDNAYLTQNEFVKQMGRLVSCTENLYYFKINFGDNGRFVNEINNLIELNLDLLIRLTDDREEILYNTVNNWAEYDFTDDYFINMYNELMEDCNENEI